MNTMKSHMLFLQFLLLAILFSCETAEGAYQLEYKINVNKDCSATWIIEHRFLKGEDEAVLRQLSDPIYFSDTFMKNIESLMNATKEKTGRTNMSAENFVMTTIVLGSYSIVEYQFHWKEFAETKDTQIAIGDVFEVEGLFLYGEGTVKIVYPSDYVVESVSPRPHAESNQTLTWYGIEDFKAGEPKIVLRKEKSATFWVLEATSKNVFLISGLLALLSLGSAGLYYFKFRRKETGPKILEAPKPLREIVNDEEKVINLLKAAGGSMYQSSIADQCGFSRSKASKLLALMESSGKIARKEKGREKVITLIEKTKDAETKNKREKHS